MLPMCRFVEIEWAEALPDSRYGHTPREAAGAMPDIEEDTAITSLEHGRIHVAGIIQFMPHSPE